jgi:magnesium transporter
MGRIGADPAASFAPFITTLVEVNGLIIHFSIALVITRGVML